MTDAVETYLQGLFLIKSSGAATKEISYYPVLAQLFNEVGKQLKPKVTCIMNIASQGAGLPDGGFFTPDQFHKKIQQGNPPTGLPSRGVIEVKGTADDSWRTAQGNQVTKYWGKYRQILVTNYRDFVLVGQDKNGKPKRLETFRLAENESDFWSATALPRKTAKEIGSRLINYIRRVMLYSAPLAEPEAVAQFLASYAHEAKDRLGDLDLPALAGLQTALEKSLGLKFRGKKGQHFFRSSLVQTLFYGVFSAWVILNKDGSQNNDFDWRQAAWLLRVPIVRELFEQISLPSKLGPLQIDEVLDWTGDTLNRIDKKAFFARFEEKHAVQYFYEPFLKAFDPALRKDMGVWFTPPEIVEYMVNRIDKVLKEELAIEDGLANPNVFVLDPAAGTGSYLVEILRKIANTLKQKGADALLADDLKQAAIGRVYGFEILPAPFVVAHLQLGLLLQSFGVQVAQDERIGIYLTNSLTGWGLAKGPQKTFDFPELEHERKESEQVKRVKPILVVLGNPPYNGFAGVSPKEEHGLVKPYKEGLRSKWGIKRYNLDELYVRFFRLAERRIAERTGKGIICYISNFSYLSSPEFVVMRKRLLSEFDKFWFDCMNGASRETGKVTPDGKPDPSVFSTKQNPVGIRVGTAICLMVRKNNRQDHPVVRFRNFWGTTKNQDLLNSLKTKQFNEAYNLVNPTEKDRYSFAFSKVPTEYYSWPSIPEIAKKNFNGPIERRGNSLISFTSNPEKFNPLQDYFDPNKTDEEIKAIAPRLMRSSGEFKAAETRSLLLKKKILFKPENIKRYPFKVMDFRLAYLDGDIQPLYSRPSPELLETQEIKNNSYIMTRDTADKQPEGSPFYYSTAICDYDCISGHARHFPVWIFAEDIQKGQTRNNKQTALKGKQATLSGEHLSKVRPFTANLSDSARTYLNTLSILNPDTSQESAETIWFHVLAIAYSPTYLAENSDGIKLGWPRIPLPRSKQALLTSASLGRKVATLLDPNASQTASTSLSRGPEIKGIAAISRVGEGSLDPSAGDLCITEGWGFGTDVVMPGVGRTESRDYSKEEKMQIVESVKPENLTDEEVFGSLGAETCDVYLNDVAYWKNVPIKVWNYTMAGYQVLKKWLSYREREVMGRGITSEEAREFADMAKRIATLLLLELSLDKNYEEIKKDSYKWVF